MRLGNERFVPPIQVCQLPCHERGEVLFGGFKVASDPPGKAFVSEFTKRTQEALSISLRGRNQLDLYSRIHARTRRRRSIVAKTARRRAVPPSAPNNLRRPMAVCGDFVRFIALLPGLRTTKNHGRRVRGVGFGRPNTRSARLPPTIVLSIASSSTASSARPRSILRSSSSAVWCLSTTPVTTN